MGASEEEQTQKQHFPQSSWVVGPSQVCLAIRFFFSKAHGHVQASLVAQLVKTPPAKQETPVRCLGQKDPLEKG